MLCAKPLIFLRNFPISRSACWLIIAALVGFVHPAAAQIDGPVWAGQNRTTTATVPQRPAVNTQPTNTFPAPVPATGWNTPQPTVNPVILPPPPVAVAQPRPAPIFGTPVTRSPWVAKNPSPGGLSYPSQPGSQPVAAPNVVVGSPDALAASGMLAAALSENRAFQRQDPKNVQLKIKEARYLSWLSRHYSAGNRYRAVLREHPNHADALAGYGNALFWQSNWRQAEKVLAQAISLADPADLAARTTYFRVLAKQGRASDAYRHAVELDQVTGHRDAGLGMFIADMLGAVGKYDDGLGYVMRPTPDVDLQVRQLAYQAQEAVNRTGRGQAVVMAEGIVTRFPNQYNAYVAAGDILAREDLERDAAAMYARGIALSPEREEALLGRARIARTRGRHDDALQLFQNVVEANPESINGWIGVAEMSRFKGDYERSWRALETAHTIAPESSTVFREKLKLAHAQEDTGRFEHVLQQFRRAQPTDPYVAIWDARARADKGQAVDISGALDPMSPELNAEALEVLREGQPMRASAAAKYVPQAPTPELDAAARRELNKTIRRRGLGSINLTTGYEYSSLKPTTVLGGAFDDWHEAYLAGFWRLRAGHTFSFDVRGIERFSMDSMQAEGGWSMQLSPRWIAGIRGGAAIANEGLYPNWRGGAEVLFLQNKKLTWGLEYRHLRFTDNPVHQLIPSVTWNWHRNFSSTARGYVTRSNPNGAPSDTGVTWYLDLLYRVRGNSHLKVHYARGDENASALIAALIGEKNFQSTGIEFRIGLSDRWAIIPNYRWERHNLFDLHAVGLHLNARF